MIDRDVPFRPGDTYSYANPDVWLVIAVHPLHASSPRPCSVFKVTELRVAVDSGWRVYEYVMSGHPTHMASRVCIHGRA